MWTSSSHTYLRAHPLLPGSLLLHIIGIAVIFCGVYVCRLQYRRYLANPAVVSVERDFYDWNGTLPGITFCYVENLSPDTTDEFIRTTWSVEQDQDKYLYYKEFLETLTSTTVYNLGELLRYHDDPTLSALDFETTLTSVIHEHDHYVSSFVRDRDITPQLILTERGLCYTVNSVQGALMAIRKQNVDSTSRGVRDGSDEEPGLPPPSALLDVIGNNKTDPIRCNFVQDQCFMKLDIFGLNASIAVHSYYEPIRYETPFYDLGHAEEVATTFKLLETINDDSVRDLTFAQRKCRFYDEEHRDEGEEKVGTQRTSGLMSKGRTSVDGTEISSSVYSVNLCLLKCRAEMAIALCGCKPHFYPFTVGECFVVINLPPTHTANPTVKNNFTQITHWTIKC